MMIFFYHHLHLQDLQLKLTNEIATEKLAEKKRKIMVLNGHKTNDISSVLLAQASFMKKKK